MPKFVNFFFIIVVVLFFFYIFTYYTSNKNIENIKMNRFNIETILEKNSLNLPVLKDDTNNIIEFNSSFDDEIKENKPRKFWNLLKVK